MRLVMSFRWAVAVLLLIFSVGATAVSAAPMNLQSANDLFAAGNAFYRSQQFEEAREAYRQLVEAGYDSAPVLYNLGTVNARLGNHTTASAYLIKARNLRPRDANIHANLEYVMPAAEDTDADAQDAARMDNLWSRVSGYFTIQEWLTITWVLFLFVCLSAATLFFIHGGRLQVAARTTMWVSVILLLMVLAPTATQYYKSRIYKQAMVLASVEMLSGPAERFTRVANLSQGQIVRDLGDAPSGFRHIRLDNGLQGYASDQALMSLQKD